MPSFGMIADSDLQLALRTFASKVVERKCSELLFHEGDKPHGCYLVKRGKVRLSMEAESRQAVMERVVGTGGLVGLPAAINGRVYSLTCEVIEDAELAYLSCQDLALLIRSDTSTGMKLLDLLSSEVQSLRSDFVNASRTAATIQG
jgi:CRP-like cAMP-binding protein